MRLQNLFFMGKRMAFGLTVLALVTGIAGIWPLHYASAGWIYVKEAPSVTVSPSVVNLTKGAKVTIAGSGFNEGDELGIRLMMGGVMSDIRHQVKPEPKVNEFGAFHSEWVLGNESRLLPEGAMALTIVNDDGDVIAHAPIVWTKPAKKEAKKK